VVVAFAVTAAIGLSIIPISKLTATGVARVSPDAGGQVGWQSFIAAVATGYRAMPAGTQASPVVFTQNYSQAGAVELVGFAANHPAPRQFVGRHIVAPVDNGYNLDNQVKCDLIWDCAGTRQSRALIWPSLVHYD
jgi:hypothetical protein